MGEQFRIAPLKAGPRSQLRRTECSELRDLGTAVPCRQKRSRTPYCRSATAEECRGRMQSRFHSCALRTIGAGRRCSEHTRSGCAPQLNRAGASTVHGWNSWNCGHDAPRDQNRGLSNRPVYLLTLASSPGIPTAMPQRKGKSGRGPPLYEPAPGSCLADTPGPSTQFT
jgi:hypothetical protein